MRTAAAPASSSTDTIRAIVDCFCHIYRRKTEAALGRPEGEFLVDGETTLRNLDWFEVTDIRGHLADGEIEYFQVTLKVGFRMEDPKT
jgi:hypothetical protein